MNKDINFKGCGTALITPFKNGEVDYSAFAALTDRQVKAGIDFLVPLGTTGETPCLEDDERIKVLQTAKEHSGGLPILVGGGTNSLKHTIRSMKMLDPYGVDAFLIVVPYYNKPTQEGQYQYFKAVAESTDKPVVLYNVPGRAGVPIAVETIARLAENPLMVAVKEAGGSVDRVSAIKNLCDITVLSGDDSLTLPMISVGAAGIISVASNIIPGELAEMVDLALKGDFKGALAYHKKYYELFRDLFIESNPIPVKAAMALRGEIACEYRLPLCEMSAAHLEVLTATLKKCGAL